MDQSHRPLPTSAWWLIAANVVPLLGVVLFGWSTFSIVFIYWCENVIIGGINLLKMFTCNPDTEVLLEANREAPDADTSVTESDYEQRLSSLVENHGFFSLQHVVAKLFIMLFFTVHYGGFCFVHGVFVFALLGGKGPFGGGGGPAGIEPFDVLGSALETLKENHLWWAILGLAGSHLYSFFRNYLGKGENRQIVLAKLMSQPYGRIIVLHVSIILGAFALLALGNPVLLLLILIVGKTGLDLKMHLREHKQVEEPAITSGGVA